jgi:hypothetical protein
MSPREYGLPEPGRRNLSNYVHTLIKASKPPG